MAEVPIFPPPPTYTPKSSDRSRLWIPSFIRRSHATGVGFGSVHGSEKVSDKLSFSEFARIRRRRSWRFLPHSKIWALVDEWWLWELFSWLFAAACVVATIAVLGAYQGQKLPAWPWGLTINAYVSILGAFAKAALLLPTAEALGQLKFSWFLRRSRDLHDFQLFDEASRGPWGSFMLIIKTRGRALAALGAAIVVLSVALDPFFQQVVAYPSRNVPVDAGSTISRARTFSTSQFDALLTVDGSPYYHPDRSLYYYVQPMMTYDHSPPPPTPPLSCSTGNCSWDPFETLGVCNTCADISHMLDYGCYETQNNWLSSVVNGSAQRYPKSRACGYFLNATRNEPRLMTGYGTTKTNDEVLLGSILALNIPDMGGTMSYYDTSINFKHLADPILDAVYVFTPGYYEGVLNGTAPIAVECNLHWCIQTVESMVRDGKLQEQVIRVVENTTSQSYPWTVEVEDQTIEYYAIPTIRSPTSGIEFGLNSNWSAFQALTSFMEGSTSYITVTNTSASPVMRYTQEGLNQTVLLAANTTPWWDVENISQHLDDIASTFSRVVRAVSNESDIIDGVAMGSETYVEIRWVWLSLPIALLTFSFVFLLLAILQSRSVGLEVWKTSALAILLHGMHPPPDAESQTAHVATSGMCSSGHNEEKEPSFKVRLKGQRGKWRFSRRHSVH